jgi:flavin reductase (DIM6/NTAB) family NADH-FMN oxidoreductase RutF
MQYDPQELEQKSIYKLLSGIVIPRPIGWISSISEEGIYNLAPFSFFNAVGDDPPHVMFSAGRNINSNQDTVQNVLATKQFVVNMVTEELVEQMNKTAQAIPSHESEFEFANLTPIASHKVKPPRVKESPITMECELVHHYTLENSKFGGSTILVGRIVLFHIDAQMMSENFKINQEKYQPISRLAGSNYARIGEMFEVKRN